LISYLTGAHVQRHRAIARGFQPTYEKLYRHPDLVNTLAELRTLREANVGDAVLRPSVISGNKYADVSKAYHLAVHDILARKVPAEAGLAALETKLADLISKLQRKNQD
jgi:trehalose/maltose transport system substrate-binding protein